jgi:hypothetical protein
MSNQHPIVPPPELVQEWAHDINDSNVHYDDRVGHNAYEQHIATCAAQWAADQELEACIQWLPDVGEMRSMLRAARRPKPPSLKEQALAELAEWENVMNIAPDSPIRRAIEQLPDS